VGERTLATAVALAALALPAAADAAPGLLEIEGSFRYVEVKDGDGRAVARRHPRKRHVRMLRRLPAGRYRVIAGEAPWARCSRSIRLLSRGLTEVAVTSQPRRRCSMTRRALPARLPSRRRIRAVQRYLRTRAGTNSWALIDNWGRLRAFAPHRVYVSASLVKAMLLTSYLRGIGSRMPDAAERAALGPMITVSSNDAADAIYYHVGDAALYRLAKLAGMTQFSVAGYWANAHFSSEDQARFFNRIDRLIPKASRAYARGLLSSIASYQRWGFSRYAAAAGFKTFFKGGWRSTGAGQLVHEAALFERGRTRVSMAVLTDGNPSHDYGTETLRGVAQRVFRRRHAAATDSNRAAAEPEPAGTPATRRAGLVDVHRFGPGIQVDLDYLTGDNVTGKPLPGYCENWALLHKRAAFNLGQVERYLRRNGIGLLILDAYRPLRATRALVRWARRSGRGDLVGTYIATRSRHNTGSAVDLTLIRLRDGKRLRMGGFDELGSGANTYNASGRILRNRLTLKNAMERFGFSGYWREWWHFEHHIRPNRYLDLTLGCGRHN
jgi:D-alanyl-D-alanine dipeptidase